jgi:predicted ATPase
VRELLGSCPRLEILATSRIPLRLYGEREYAVPPLAVPDPRVLPPLEALTQYEAVRLFVERAKAVEANFLVTNENAPAVAEICARLDGLPLAIELAAARVRLLSPQAMLTRLDNRLKLLKGGARDLPTRQQTLRRTIDWSYELLGEEEKTLFGRISIFAGVHPGGNRGDLRLRRGYRRSGGGGVAPREEPLEAGRASRARATPRHARDRPRVC